MSVYRLANCCTYSILDMKLLLRYSTLTRCPIPISIPPILLGILSNTVIFLCTNDTFPDYFISFISICDDIVIFFIPILSPLLLLLFLCFFYLLISDRIVSCDLTLMFFFIFYFYFTNCRILLLINIILISHIINKYKQ